MTLHQSIPMLLPEEAAKLRGRGPVSSKPYFDPEWWELERNAIFMRSWLHIGHVCEVPEPGSFIQRQVEFARASLLIVRGRDGEVRTFHNACTHRGTQLTQESCGKKSRLVCPYHAWTFGTDGQLISAPDFERFGVAREDVALKQVRTEVVAGLIFINFDPNPSETAQEFLGAIADELALLPSARAVDFTEWTYDIPANWKTNYDNFQENYHLRFVHPLTAGQLGVGPENPFGYPTHYGFLGPHRSQQLWLNPNPQQPAPIVLQAMMPGMAFAQQEGLDYPKNDIKVFPNFQSVGMEAGQQFTQTHFPLSVDRTRCVVRTYWTKQADSATRLFVQEFASMGLRDVLAEDRWPVEAAQRGISGGAIEQFHFQDHEMLLRHQYEEVVARVEAYVAECRGKGAAP